MSETMDVCGGNCSSCVHPAHLYFKRALGLAFLFGSASAHRASVVELSTADDLATEADDPGNDDSSDAALVELASDDQEREFAASALAFLSARTSRRGAVSPRWGVGEEGIALFHGSEGGQERAEPDVGRAWQRQRWDAGFGWITGPERFGGRGLPASYERLYREVESAFEFPDMNPIRIGLRTVGHPIP